MKRPLKAFSLVELLVVISIIAMLLAILLPSLGRARRQGKRVVCLSNVRQMHIAAITYSQSYDGYFPIAQYSDENTGSSYSWDFSTLRGAGGPRIVAGILWQGDTIAKIQQCPEFRGTSNTDPLIRYSGYNYNTSFVGHGQGEAVEKPARVCSVRRPTGCALFGDGQWTGGANKYMRSPFRKGADDRTFTGRTAGAQGFRHLNKTTVVWADGHGSSPALVFAISDGPRDDVADLIAYNRKAGHSKVGFLSIDNSAYDLD